MKTAEKITAAEIRGWPDSVILEVAAGALREVARKESVRSSLQIHAVADRLIEMMRKSERAAHE